MAPSSPSLQPTRRVPLSPVLERRAGELGATSLCSSLNLWVDQGVGTKLRMVEFHVDSGASFTMMSRWQAETHGLTLPPLDCECSVPLTTTAGKEQARVRPGRLRVWLFQTREGDPFDWPVLYLMDAPPETPPVLGLAGVVESCRWTFDGRPSGPAFRYGSFTLEDVRG